jgi:hypothetical protein
MVTANRCECFGTAKMKLCESTLVLGRRWFRLGVSTSFCELGWIGLFPIEYGSDVGNRPGRRYKGRRLSARHQW